eukprot:3133146-Rhodomonas_salina.1
MGNCFSPSLKQLKNFNQDAAPRFYAIADNYNSIEEVQKALRGVGLESSDLVLGVDFTGSNKMTGKISFGGLSLHDTSTGVTNPYQQVISIVGRTLEAFDDDKLIPAYGFGDKTTGSSACFPFQQDGSASHGFEEVLERYNAMTPTLHLAGPTNFAPVIRKTIETVKEERAYHILVIIADGQITHGRCEDETKRAIVEASKYPISIVVIGVGDGPWGQMEEFDDELPQRKFDNFQFVPFNKTINSVPAGRNVDAAFACAALMEIPEQYRLIKQLGYLN